MATTGTNRLRNDISVNNATLLGDLKETGNPKFFTNLATQTAAAVDIGAATLFLDMAAGLAALGNATIRMQSANVITKLILYLQTTTAANVGNVTLSVRDSAGSAVAATSVLAGTSSSLAVGATQPVYGAVTFTFNRPVPAGTVFTVAVLGSVSGTRTYFLNLQAETN